MNVLLANNNPLFGATTRGIYVFGLEIYYYAICIVCGMILAAFLSALLMRRRNMSSDLIFILFIVCIPSAIVCARLYYCITDGMPINQWYDVRSGGLSILGGVLGGVLAGFIVCKIKKVSFLRAADCVVVNILIAQVLGRWGNFFNGEVYGLEVANPALQFFPFAVPIAPGCSGIESFFASDAKWCYALFFYELVFNLIGWVILFTTAWFRKKKPNGILTCLYFVWYGVVRACMEPFRDQDFILGNADGKMHSEMTAILMVLIAVACILILLIINHVKEGSFIGSKRGDPCGITNYMPAYKDEKPYFSKVNMFGANYPPRPPKEKRGMKNDPASEEAAERIGEGVKTEKTDETDGEKDE